MADETTQRLDPLGDLTRNIGEVKMTGAQLMDLVDERDAAVNAVVEMVTRLRSAVALVFPDDMTPSGKRVFDSILKEFGHG